MFPMIESDVLLNDYLLPWGTRLLLAALIFFAGRWISRLLLKLVGRLMERARVEEILRHFVLSIAAALLLLVVVIAALDQLGVDTTSLVALVGAAGLAIGLALQDSLKNFAAGVMLIVFRPFKAGDFVEAAKVVGTVEKIHIFSSMLRTPDNREIVIPNGKIYSDVIVNYSARETRRIDMLMSIDYGDDIKQAKQIIADIVAADPRVLKDPEPVVAVAELAASSIDLHVRPWVRSADYFSTMCDLKERIKVAFDEAGITIPFPQRALHLPQATPSPK